jgi:peptidoglycan/LPS O-acetylase OafA/YrhL
VKALSVSALKADVAFVAGVSVLVTGVWAATGDGNFWPKWTLIWLGAVLAGHAGLIVAARQPPRWPLTRGLLNQLVVSGVWWLALVVVWLVGASSGFWPGWVLLAVVVAAGAHLAVSTLLNRPQRVLTEQVRVPSTTRHDAAEKQEAPLDRERDLHDGAQARRVAPGG